MRNRAIILEAYQNTAPNSPGCYLFKDKSGQILYVGKAINIRNRIKQYFKVVDNGVVPLDNLEPIKKIMVGKIFEMEFVTTDSEIEALLLETNLIKKYRPKYNRLMRDDKNYSYIMVTRNENFPRLVYVREKKTKGAMYLGPYPSTFPAKQTLKNLRKIFPYRTCRRKIVENVQKNGELKIISSDPKPCLYYHLGLCNAPCAGLENKKQYRKNINAIVRYLRGDKGGVSLRLTRDMRESSRKQNFEEAAIIRDRIEQLTYVSQNININEDIDAEKWREYKKQRRQEGLANLCSILKQAGVIKESKLHRIECYDISNISGKSAVGSMVVFHNGKSAKAHYRKFKIKTKDTPDDYEMMREVLKRRFNEGKNKNNDLSFASFPDLIIIDGGKGQLSMALEVMSDLKLDVPVVGLAKREERLIWQDKLGFHVQKLKDKSEEKFLVQRIRDEAHRFAIAYHRKLRSNVALTSRLDNIAGIGDVTKARLLNEFKDVKSMQRAGKNHLQKVVRNKRTVENIMKYL